MKTTNKTTTPYKTGDGSYNRESGRKTVLFVGICIALVTAFSLLALINLM